MARPEKPIDWELVEEMIDAQCNGVEIAAYFNVIPQTFYYKFKDHYETDFSSYSPFRSQCGKGAIKLAQYRKALNEDAQGSTQLLIWLGKVMLGQKESDHVASVDEQASINMKALLDQLAEAQARAKACTNSNTDCKS